MTETPRTDNAMQQIACFAEHPAVECLADLSRTLERERAAEKARVERLRNALGDILEMAEQREDIKDGHDGPRPDAWMEVANRCREALGEIPA